MSKLRFERSWQKKHDGTAVGATDARLKIIIDGIAATEYRGEFDGKDDAIELPLYYLGEWVAENWWPLLWEPRKTEAAGDEEAFLSRHSILAAQHGFTLPQVIFAPNGAMIDVSAKARNAPLADVRFLRSARATIPRQDVEAALRKFLSGISKRLADNSHHDTDLQSYWGLISGTSDEEAQFCQLMGSIGLSPYAEENGEFGDIILNMADRHSFKAIMDLCQASSAEGFKADAALTDVALNLTATAPEASLEPLLRRALPADNPAAPGWRHGVSAARTARTALQIKDNDPEGGRRFFDALGIDTARASNTLLVNDGEAVVGAVARDDTRSRIALLQNGAPQRRFTAARGAYLAWTADDPHSSRLMTMAVTREQQASRAFAAEMVAPINYIRRYAKSSKINVDTLHAIANELVVGFDVVKNQADNNHLLVTNR